MTKLKPVLIVAVALIVTIAAYLLFFRKTAVASELIQPVKRADFEVLVVTSGELRSKSNTRIMMPSGLQQVGIYQIKIGDMVAEGTTVKAGDFVASLDNSAITDKVSQMQLEVDKMNAQIRQANLDTMLEMRALRDEIVNLKFDLRQKLLEKEQSKFEAPAEIKRVELDYERTERTLKQKEENYKTKTIQAQTKLQILGSDLQQLQNRMNNLVKLMGQLNITAPKGGMVIYEKNWNGQKKTTGSQIEVWNPSVATLPDLTQMEVVTYINEVDIQKVKVGQHVDISLDAAADKKLKGVVKSVANIGEEKPNSDAKVFEVVIDILTKDETLRPSMTASCRIQAEKYEKVLQVPLDAIYSGQQTSFVFKRGANGLIKQEVKVFTVNENAALISNGLQEGDRLYYSLPADTSGLQLVKADSTKAITPKQLVQIDTALVKQLKEQAGKESKSGSGEAGVVVIED
jgi:multidrug efflux pump subunit AcrA (membrane-fusion protein)